MPDDNLFDRSRLREEPDPFRPREISQEEALQLRSEVHRLPGGFRCDTERAGHPTPDNKSPLELVLDATEGFIPLWDQDVVLRWQFAKGTLDKFQNPTAAGAAIEELLAEAILAWGDAAPVKFSKNANIWDFEIVVRGSDDCDGGGCVLASAFFPDAGRHQLEIYPMMFEQPRREQVETLIHEIGHIFGLRHFFALISETAWAAEVFGEHNPFTIMNYGDESVFTDTDRADLKRLYTEAWSGALTHINGTPIRLVRPYHETPARGGAVAIAAART
ncbi:matrixin family metalloprotease [Phenylobacterium sp.]|uniref:matrixin family metalloprotease n=1 Tax=Phenylobacterium sp. TaxID=1871053 RepID=UPI0035B172F8